MELVEPAATVSSTPTLTEHIRHQIDMAMTQASLVLFIVDCQSGLTSADEEIASLLRRRSIKTVLVANKADGPNADVMLGGFRPLGPWHADWRIGAQQSQYRSGGGGDRKNLDLSNAPTEMPSPQLMLAIVGNAIRARARWSIPSPSFMRATATASSSLKSPAPRATASTSALRKTASR